MAHPMLAASALAEESSVVTVGILRVDLSQHATMVDGVEVHLMPRQQELLEFLARNCGRAMHRVKIHTHLYGSYGEEEIKNVDIQICLLRQNLDSASSYIQTVWGVGYGLYKPPAQAAE